MIEVPSRYPSRLQIEEDDETGIPNIVKMYAIKHGVDPDLALRIAKVESEFNQKAVSPKGAIGVMQLIPSTAKELGVNPFDLHQNIEGGIRYLKKQLEEFGDPELALAAYNAGPGRVRSGAWRKIKETVKYVGSILGPRQAEAGVIDPMWKALDSSGRKQFLKALGGSAALGLALADESDASVRSVFKPIGKEFESRSIAEIEKRIAGFPKHMTGKQILSKLEEKSIIPKGFGDYYLKEDVPRDQLVETLKKVWEKPRVEYTDQDIVRIVRRKANQFAREDFHKSFAQLKRDFDKWLSKNEERIKDVQSRISEINKELEEHNLKLLESGETPPIIGMGYNPNTYERFAVSTLDVRMHDRDRPVRLFLLDDIEDQINSNLGKYPKKLMDKIKSVFDDIRSIERDEPGYRDFVIESSDALTELEFGLRKSHFAYEQFPGDVLLPLHRGSKEKVIEAVIRRPSDEALKSQVLTHFKMGDLAHIRGVKTLDDVIIHEIQSDWAALRHRPLGGIERPPELPPEFSGEKWISNTIKGALQIAAENDAKRVLFPDEIQKIAFASLPEEKAKIIYGGNLTKQLKKIAEKTGAKYVEIPFEDYYKITFSELDEAAKSIGKKSVFKGLELTPEAREKLKNVLVGTGLVVSTIGAGQAEAAETDLFVPPRINTPEDLSKILEKEVGKQSSTTFDNLFGSGIVADVALGLAAIGLVHPASRVVSTRVLPRLIALSPRAQKIIKFFGLSAKYGAQGATFAGLKELLTSEGAESKFIGEDASFPAKAGEEALLWIGFGHGVPAALSAMGKGVRALDKTTRYLTKPISETWGNVLDKAREGIIDPIAKVTGLDKVGRIVQEHLQPAVHRIRRNRPTVGMTIDKSEAMKETTKKVGREMSVQLSRMPLSQRLEVAKAFRSKGETSDPVAKQLYDKWMKAHKDFSDPYMKAMSDTIRRIVTKPLENVDENVAKELYETYEKSLSGTIRRRHIEKIADKIVENPNTPEELVQLTKDLMMMSARFQVDVSRAAQRGMLAHLGWKLKRTPGVVSNKPKEGFVKSKDPMFRGMWIDRDVELHLKAARQIPRIAEGLYNRWFLNMWKTNKVILRPAAQMRNIFSNVVMNDIGGLPFYRWDIYKRALQEMRNNGPLMKEWMKYSGRQVDWSHAELAEIAGPIVKYKGSMLDKLFNLHASISAPARASYAAVENWCKLAKYIHNKELGMAPREAALDALKWTHNYAEITPFIAKVKSHPLGMPFFTWTAKTIPLFIEASVKHPMRVAKWWLLFNELQNRAISQVGISDEEWKIIQSELPEYMNRGFYLLMPWRDEKGNLKLMNMTWTMPGIGDMAELAQRVGDPLAGIAPAITLASSIRSGVRETGSPIYHEWEHPQTKFAKVLSYAWEFWAPAPAPGGTDWKMLWEAMEERPEALSPNEAVAAFFGAKLTTVDPVANSLRRAAIQKIHEAEAKAMMMQELRRAKTEKEMQRIIDSYRWVRESSAERYEGESPRIYP